MADGRNDPRKPVSLKPQTDAPSRRSILLAGTALAATALSGSPVVDQANAQQSPSASAAGSKPNILMIMGDDIGWFNPSIYHRGIMGYRTPNIDRIGNEGAMFTDWYGEQSCTAGRAAFITGQSPIRTGLTKVGLPGADLGLSALDPSVAEFLKALGYNTGQFGKNHLGDKDEFLPTNHGFDEFFGNLYHLNAEEEPENSDYPKNPQFKKRFGPRGVIHSYAGGKIEDTGPLTLTTRPRLLRLISWTDSRNPGSRGSVTSTQRGCTSTRISSRKRLARLVREFTLTAWWSTMATSDSY
jgi:hypothetical protein